MIDAQKADRLLADLAPVLSLSDSALRALIPTRSGLRFVGCPNCTAGTQENQLWWTIEHPDEVYCKHCDIRYPNDKYPDDQILRVIDATGQTQEYPYWDDADGYHHFFQAKGWYVAKLYFEDAALKLARLYATTGDEEHAQRAGLILQRFAEVYPGYLVHYDFPFRQKILWPGDSSFPYPVPDFRAAKWAWWAYMDISEDLLLAYELIRDSGALDDDAREQIEAQLFHAMVAYINNYPPALTNMDPTLLRGLITAGRILHEPAYMHDAVRRIGLLVQQQFFADGVWREGALSYHNQTVNGLNQLIDLLDGYSDPPDYVPPAGETRFDDLDITAQLPILRRARGVAELLRYPNGRVVAFHDTWAREQIAPTQQTTSMLLPELGHARLGHGSAASQMQAHLHFSGGYGHQHADVLGMTLFARGQERLGDIGYTHTRDRAWTLTTLSHNTVTVNGQDQHGGSAASPSDGALQLFIPADEDGDVLSVVEASGERAYPGLVDEYRRLLALIDAGDDGYVVDLFRVVGGSRHEYVLTGDADHDGALEHGLATRPYGDMLLPEGTQVMLPTGESTPGDAGDHNLGYAYIRDVEQADIEGPWQATFTSDAPAPGAVRVHGAALSDDDVLFTARAPSIRRAGEDDANLSKYDMPMLVHRREGPADSALTSAFVTVLESYGAEPFIDSVERLPVETSAGEGLAVRIRWGEITDILLIGATDQTVVASGDFRLQGRLGFVRMKGDRVEQMRLVGGTSLQVGDTELQGAGILRGHVRSTLRRQAGHAVDGLLVDLTSADTPLPDLVGLWVVVIDGAGYHHGHRIAAVEHDTEAGVMLRLDEDPGYEVSGDTGRQVYFPGRSWQGQTTIEIATVSR